MIESRQTPDPPRDVHNLAPPAGYEKHYLGRFGEKVIAYLGRGENVGFIGNGAFVIVDSIELGDDLFREEIGIDFHFSKTPPPRDHVPHWGATLPGHDVEILFTEGSGIVNVEPSYSFTFTSEIPFEENVQEFLEFIKGEIIVSCQHDSESDDEESSPAVSEDVESLETFTTGRAELHGFDVDLPPGRTEQGRAGVKKPFSN